MLRRLFIAASTLAFAAPAVRAGEAAPIELQQTYDIPYTKGRDAQLLDVFGPKGARDKPVVLFIHGGGWMIGDKNLFGIYRGVGRELARMDAVAVLINYRLSPGVKHPEHVKDVARAFAWVRSHIADYGGDPDRIIVAGHSAGGHLAALLATDDRYLRDPALGLKDADLAALRGVVAVSGVYRIPESADCARVVGDLLSGLPDLGDRRARAALAFAPNLIRTTPRLNPFRLAFGDDPAVHKQASPLTHVHKGLPPFLLLYAQHELPLVGDQAGEFAKALQADGVPAELKRIDHVDHNTILWWMGQRNDPAGDAIHKFLDEYARPARTAKS
jgi:acetyl esterase/lipase